MQRDEEVYDFIIQNAKGLFQRYGLKKTTMEDIAKSSGKGKSTLYYYFKSKDEIFEAVVQQEMEIFIKELKEVVLQVKDAHIRLKLYCTENLKNLRKKANLYQIVFNELTNQLGLMHKLRQTFSHLELDFLKQILNEGIENNEFNLKQEEVAWFADIIAASLRGIELNMIWFEEYPDLEEKVEKMIDVFYNGIRVRS